MGRDGASSNDYVVGGTLHRLPPDILGDDCSCGNHRNNLCEASTIAAIGVQLITSLYMMCCMLRMGSTYLRLILFLDELLSRVTDDNIIRVAPTPQCYRFAEELKRYAMANCKQSYHWRTRRKGHRDDLENSPSQKAVDAYSALWVDFLSVFNTSCAKGLMHACRSWSCCQGVPARRASATHAPSDQGARLVPHADLPQ